MVARQGRRAAFGMVAFIFVIGVLILAEVTGWQALRLYVALAPIAATLILLGVNLVIAGIFSLLAVRSSPGHAEQEALRVRRQALEAVRGLVYRPARKERPACRQCDGGNGCCRRVALFRPAGDRRARSLRHWCARRTAADREPLKEPRRQIGGFKPYHFLIGIDARAHPCSVDARENAGVGE
jgi:hypothetical protein